MPLLGYIDLNSTNIHLYYLNISRKDKRKVVMQKFQDEAKAQGIELPSMLTDLDPESGMPQIFDVKMF